MSGQEKTTTTGSNEPWSAAQPALKQGLGDAQDLYGSGNLFKPYTGSTVVPWSADTQSGMNSIRTQSNDALASGAMSKPLDFYGSMFQNGGLSADQQGVADQWRTTASGSEMGQVSPAFAAALQAVQDSARDNVNMSVSGAGRYGSGQHTDVLAKSVGDVTNRMMVDEYGRQRGRQDAARANLAGLGQQGINNQFGAGSAMPGAWTASQQPATDLMKVGSMEEDLQGRTLADQLRIWQEQQGQGQKSIEWLNAIGSGAGNLGGTQSQTTTAPGTNPFVQALGYALGGGNILSSLFGGA